MVQSSKISPSAHFQAFFGACSLRAVNFGFPGHTFGTTLHQRGAPLAERFF
jgi:hypothetical protein